VHAKVVRAESPKASATASATPSRIASTMVEASDSLRAASSMLSEAHDDPR
jgi:hypothetical protein